MHFERLTVLSLALSPLYAFSSTYTVTNNSDNGAGSLRQAIIDANSTPANPNQIVFNASLTGGNTITLSSFLPFIENNLTIDGSNNPSLVISGGGSVEVCLPTPGFSLMLQNFTMSNLTAQGGARSEQWQLRR